jgi:hypothetical protein
MKTGASQSMVSGAGISCGSCQGVSNPLWMCGWSAEKFMSHV